jgi:hypothetical protein
MAGLIDVSILKPGLAGATYREAEQAKQQTELNQIKLEQLKQDAIALKDLQVKMRAAGQSDDPNVFFRALIQTGKPEYMEKGYEGLRRYDELRRNESMLRSLEPDLFAKPGAAPTAAPAAAPTAGAGAPTAAPAAAPTAAAPAAGAGAQTATNALAPMTAETPDINALRRRLTALSLINDPRAKAMAKVVEGQINELSKSTTVAPGGTVIQGGKPIYTAPAAPAPLARLIAARDALPVGSADRLAIEAQINKDIAGNRVFDPNTGLLIDKVTGQPVSPGATPAGQPGVAPLVPGIAPVQAQQNQTGGFPRVTPQVQAARDTDRLAILERELASQQAAGRVDPALQAEIDNARRQAGVPAPQPRVSVPNALAGASVNALAGAPTGAPIPANPAERMAAFKKQLEVAGAGPEAETKKRHELLVDQYKDISKAAQLASKTLPALESNLAILDRGFTTGFGTEAMAAGAKVLGALGVQNAEKFATNSQTFLANATQSVLQRQLEQKGTQSEGDYQRIKDTGSQLGNTKEANKFILSVAKAQLQRDIDQRKFYDQWQKQNKTYDGAEDAWFSGEGGKSLFDTPALREYSSKTPTGGAVSPQGRPSLDSIFGGKPQR